MEQKKKIRGVLLDIEKNEANEVEFVPSLEEYYKMLRCNLIEMPTRTIGGKRFDVVCDEEGTFKQNAKISAIDDLGRVMFVGSLLIVGMADEDGNETSLTTQDVAMVMSHIEDVCTHSYPQGYKMLTGCEY